MSLIGVNSLPIALITRRSPRRCSLQSAVQLVRFGQGVYVGGLVAASVARKWRRY